MTRRWFQFRLPTLLVAMAVVAVPLSWLARQAAMVRERQMVLSKTSHQGGGSCSTIDGLPWTWALFGATKVIDLDTGGIATKADLDRLHLLFPETKNVQHDWKYLRDDLPD